MTIEPVQPSRPRAGLWRRLLAFIIDMVVVLIPLQIVVAILFAQTNGAIQGSFGLKFNACAHVEKLPDGLQPPPPSGYNFIIDCRTSLLGFEVARNLTVGKETQTGNTRSGVFVTYPLGADGMPKDNVFYANWIAILILFAYLVFMETRSGVTFGKRCVDVRAIDLADLSQVGLPVRKAVTRQLAKMIGSIPAFVVLLILYANVGGVEDMQRTLGSPWFKVVSIGGSLLGVAWLLWIVVSLARKNDPIYDRLAGTSVILK
jgi:uncharacterized RDD family membrane protein YckC